MYLEVKFSHELATVVTTTLIKNKQLRVYVYLPLIINNERYINGDNTNKENIDISKKLAFSHKSFRNIPSFCQKL